MSETYCTITRPRPMPSGFSRDYLPSNLLESQENFCEYAMVRAHSPEETN
ncbi:hypothetical protein H2508_07840 [Parahaliea sp. F7430]|uniref:Uncharacterized protein n=1 Tax=Sediminihaliea albiluteola TaxID=2758564 RepID=A0A7W2TW59_9GAMM|nr:hypothetical protein [Sediminihaliea albiluteola]MBA6413021.1 hypothetical protein [Sediminihaliea albiluteola]